MKIIDKKLTEITPYANNPRKNDEAVDKVASSIQEFGFKQPICDIIIDRWEQYTGQKAVLING